TLAALVLAVGSEVAAVAAVVAVTAGSRRPRSLAQRRTIAADRTQRLGQRRLELGELVVHVHVALAAQALGIRVGGLHDPSGLLVRLVHDGGLGHQALLLGEAVLHGAVVGRVARRDEAV